MNSFPVRTAKQLGPILQGYRKSHSLSQQQVGQRVGLMQKQVSKLEMDPSNVSLSNVFKVLAALNLELVVQERKSAPQSEW